MAEMLLKVDFTLMHLLMQINKKVSSFAQVLLNQLASLEQEYNNVKIRWTKRYNY